MITILIVVEVILLASCSFKRSGAKIENNLSEKGLFGKIKFLTETQYRGAYVNGSLEKGNIITRCYELFNEDGNVIEWKMYDSNAILLDELCNKYDNSGKIIESVNSESKRIIKYDNNGNQTEINIFSNDGALKERCIKNYDMKRNKVEESHFDSNGDLVSNYIIVYGKNGEKLEINVYKPDGRLEFKSTSRYNSKGRKTEGIDLFYNENIVERKDLYEYNEKEEMVKHINHYMGRTEKSSFQYDDYDLHGNWQLKVQLDPTMSIIEREIVYY